jgi:leucyl aminopeptidase (aminopeptidase T)
MNKKIVRIIIRDCMGFRKGEHVLIVTDNRLQMLARFFYKVLKEDNVKSVLLKMPCGKMHGQEPPKKIASALKAADIAILLTAMSLSHTVARKQASKKAGTRIASLPSVTAEILQRSIKLNYASLKRQVAKVSRRLTKGNRLEIYTDKGTHLVMSIRGRRGCPDDGVYTKPGAFGNLPAGEACIAPCEGTAQGILMADASAPLTGKLKRPIRLTIKNGYVENIPIAKIASLIRPLGKAALNVAEVGIGLNPKARVTGNILEDEKVKQTAHLAIGANVSFGGRVSCPCHLDFVFFKPRILIDGKRLTL